MAKGDKEKMDRTRRANDSFAQQEAAHGKASVLMIKEFASGRDLNTPFLYEDFRAWLQQLEDAAFADTPKQIEVDGETVDISDEARRQIADATIGIRAGQIIDNLKQSGYLMVQDGKYTFTSSAKALFAKK